MEDIENFKIVGTVSALTITSETNKQIIDGRYQTSVTPERRIKKAGSNDPANMLTLGERAILL